MNRFTTYLTSQKLAKSHLITASEHLRRGDHLVATDHLIRSVREFQTCINSLASLHFEPRKKRRVVPS